MARVTAASAGKDVRNIARIRHILTCCACSLSRAKASQILEIYKLAKCFTIPRDGLPTIPRHSRHAHVPHPTHLGANP